ncbi:hypothetical protein BpHYR1_043981 [Brachionus plicatilis]|uniref:RNA-directed DNA polymerase from mobile element jockey-like n=1 Tax=Brachionus plicatilis TaxID=10195 RepID=A0A3M7QV42_BRAPC|nr:hypothetical protein BpHYR1_043981 [Brachionus plicatilis]
MFDDSILFSYFSDPYFTIKRKDRARDGGAALFMMRLKLFQLKFKQKMKPPSLNNLLFLNNLEQFIITSNTNNRLVIVGDLNMVHVDSDTRFLDFLNNYNLRSITYEPTRI